MKKLNKLFKKQIEKCKTNIQNELYDAIENGNIDLVKKAIKLGANIEMPDDIGNTALQLAALCEDYNMVDFF